MGHVQVCRECGIARVASQVQGPLTPYSPGTTYACDWGVVIDKPAKVHIRREILCQKMRNSPQQSDRKDCKRVPQTAVFHQNILQIIRLRASADRNAPKT